MFDSFMLYHMNKVIEKQVVGYHLQRVFFNGNMHLGLKFRSNLFLNIDLSAESSHVNLSTERSFEGIDESPFLLQLRNGIEKKKLVDTQQLQEDRVLQLTFQGRNHLMEEETLHVILELMGRHSNLIVTDDKYVIRLALKYTPKDAQTAHIISPGGVYKPLEDTRLPFEGPMAFHEINCKEIKSCYGKLRRWIEKAGWAECTLSEIKDKIHAADTFYLYMDEEGKPEDFHCFSLPHSIPYKELTALLNDYYSQVEYADALTSQKANYQKIIHQRLAQLKKKENILREELLRAKDAGMIQREGELLQAYMYQLENYLPEVTVYDYYDEVERKILLNPEKTIVENFTSKYKEFEKQKRAKVEKEKQMEETKILLERLQQMDFSFSLVDNREELNQILWEMEELSLIRKKKSLKEKVKSSPIYFEFMETPYVVGKNNQQNQKITFQTKNRSYGWFHVKNLPGSHVIMMKELDTATEEEIAFGGKLALWYSKAKGSSNVAVDYTQLKYVKNPKGSAPGFVIYTHEKTIYPSADLETVLKYKK